MNKKNTRVKLLTEDTVNEITLNDLLDYAGKAESALMLLADKCMKYTGSSILKQKAANLKKQCSELTDAIRGQLMSNSQEDVAKKTVLDSNEEKAERLESVLRKKGVFKNFTKLIKEALEEEETEETNDTDDIDSESDNTEKSNKIDLSSSFSNVINGLSDEQFSTFKNDVIQSMKASGIADGAFLSIVQEIEKTQTVDDFNFALDKLYDYADENGIEIITEPESAEANSLN